MESEIHLCDYGCGQEGKFLFGNGKWCCSHFYSKCPVARRKNTNGLLGKKHPRRIRRENPGLCDYGCGQEAKFYFKTSDKWCCSSRWNKCPENWEKVSNHLKKRKCRKGIKIEENENIKCDYGCGSIAKFFFPTVKKYCCSDTFGGCKTQRKLNSKRMKDSWEDENSGHHSENRKQKRSDYMKNGGADISNTEESRIKARDRLKDKTFEEIYGEEKAVEMKKKIGKKSKQRMLNGGAVHALSFTKNPSRPQVELFNRIKEEYSTAVLNYPCLQLNYSLDIAIPELKIWFESDGSWYHQDKEKDLKRQKEIEDLLEWKCIRYFPVDTIKQVPTIDQILKDINDILKGEIWTV